MTSGRIASGERRAAFSKVQLIDLAFPLGAPGDIAMVQLLVKTKASF
jgi:hypothetical protein